MARILILSFVEWAGAFQRPQHLALGLARRGHEVTYLEPGYLHRPAGAAAGAAQPPPSLRVVRAGLLPGASRALLIERLNLALLARRARALSSLPWDAVIFNDPRFATAAAAIPARRRVFDCMDDLSGQAASPTALATAEAAALTIADRVWTGTGMLESRLAGRHPSVRFIPCGVDYDLFSRPPGLIPAERLGAELPPGEGPLAGFFGVLNERFDARLLSPLLEAGWRVLLIGPATSRRPALPDHPALRAIGPRPYGELPDYLVRFDLGLIPYDTHGPHRFLYPVKALEYLAGGRPVLATPLPDLARFLSPFLELAEGPEGWAAAARRLRDDPAPARLRARAGQAHAAGRSWDAMVGEMEADLLEGGDG